MKTNSILLQQLTIEQLEQLIGKSIKNGISQLHREQLIKNFNEELLSREQTCQFLKIDSSTLWSWTNKGKVKAYGIGARRYYKRSELLESLSLLKK